MAEAQAKPQFKSGIGRWAGTAEVYDGSGEFLGHALDRRNVEKISDTKIRINLSFMGPLMLSGHYVIETHENHRLYRGPANVGYAEALSEGLVEAHNYWSHWGLSQRFFLFVTPEKDMQMSLALLSRGEQLQYVVVGEYYRLPDDENSDPNAPVAVPESLLVPGTPQDKKGDPTAGRGEILVHRSGKWQGDVTILDGEGNFGKTTSYTQVFEADDSNNVKLHVEGGGLVSEPYGISWQSNGWQAWTGAGSIVGSYSITGGRAISGQFHHLDDECRVWIREVVTGDGSKKAILHVFYRGGERVGIQFGLLNFSEKAV